MQKLEKILSSNLTDFRCLGDTIDTPDGQLTFIDNGADVLAVAHLDTVMQTKFIWDGWTIKNCPQLDDRLGVWTLLNLLPDLDCPKFDILLTDGEESGRSTAQHFETNKQYNWMFEFDRAGNDMVMYDYEDDDLIDLMGEYDWDVGSGSFTDICFLEHLDAKGFNFGVGYYGQHTKKCYADIQDTVINAQKFIAFMKDFGGTLLPHDSESIWQNYEPTHREPTHREPLGYDVRPSSNAEWCTDCNECLETWWSYCPTCGKSQNHFARV